VGCTQEASQHHPQRNWTCGQFFVILSHSSFRNSATNRAAAVANKGKWLVTHLIMSRRGVVVRSKPATFAGLEKAARQQDAKGVFYERGPHAKAAQTARWLDEQEEDDLMFGEFASAQLLVATPSCDESDCDEEHSAPELATDADVEAALDRLVADLPASFRSEARTDAAALLRLSRTLCPGVPWITLRIEILHRDACWRWHQDGNVGRTLVCYVGPGTRAADDAAVD